MVVVGIIAAGLLLVVVGIIAAGLLLVVVGIIAAGLLLVVVGIIAAGLLLVVAGIFVDVVIFLCSCQCCCTKCILYCTHNLNSKYETTV